jgi:hypothetical protein
MTRVQSKAAGAPDAAIPPTVGGARSLSTRFHLRLLTLAALSMMALSAPARAALTLSPTSVNLSAGASAKVQITGAAGEIHGRRDGHSVGRDHEQRDSDHQGRRVRYGNGLRA